MHRKFVQLLNAAKFVRYLILKENMMMFKCCAKPVGGSANSKGSARN